MSKVNITGTYPGEDTDSIRRAIGEIQRFSTEIDTKTLDATSLPYQMLSEDDLLLITTGLLSYEVTLPALDDAQRKSYYIKKTDANVGTIVVTGSGSEPIDGGNILLTKQYDAVHVIPQRETDTLTTKRKWWVVSFVHEAPSLIRSVSMSYDDWNVGAVSPTLSTPGTTPEGDAYFFDATNESIRTYISMPAEWDKRQDVTLRMLVGTFGTETNNDTLSTEIDYIILQAHTPGEGSYSITSTNLTDETDFTAGQGLTSTMYYIDFVLDKDDSENGWAPTDLADGFGFEFHMTNLTQVASIFVFGSKLIYTTLY